MVPDILDQSLALYLTKVLLLLSFRNLINHSNIRENYQSRKNALDLFLNVGMIFYIYN